MKSRSRHPWAYRGVKVAGTPQRHGDDVSYHDDAAGWDALPVSVQNVQWQMNRLLNRWTHYSGLKRIRSEYSIIICAVVTKLRVNYTAVYCTVQGFIFGRVFRDGDSETEGPRHGWGFWRGGSEPRPYQNMGSGECCKLPSEVGGEVDLGTFSMT